MYLEVERERCVFTDFYYYYLYLLLCYFFFFDAERERLGCIAQDPLVFFPLVISVHPVVPIFLAKVIFL